LECPAHHAHHRLGPIVTGGDLELHPQEALAIRLDRIRALLDRLDFIHDDGRKAKLILQLQRERAEALLLRETIVASGAPTHRSPVEQPGR
jgi:hypothetical protein